MNAELLGILAIVVGGASVVFFIWRRGTTHLRSQPTRRVEHRRQRSTEAPTEGSPTARVPDQAASAQPEVRVAEQAADLTDESPEFSPPEDARVTSEHLPDNADADDGQHASAMASPGLVASPPPVDGVPPVVPSETVPDSHLDARRSRQRGELARGSEKPAFSHSEVPGKAASASAAREEPASPAPNRSTGDDHLVSAVTTATDAEANEGEVDKVPTGEPPAPHKTPHASLEGLSTSPEEVSGAVPEAPDRADDQAEDADFTRSAASELNGRLPQTDDRPTVTNEEPLGTRQRESPRTDSTESPSDAGRKSSSAPPEPGPDEDTSAIQVPSAIRPASPQRRPRRYKGLHRGPPSPRRKQELSPTPTTPSTSLDEPARPAHPLPIEVRLQFDRSGFCSISLLPKRSTGLPEALAVTGPTGDHEFLALQDEWYAADVIPEELSLMLREGVRWTARDEAQERSWSLSGRDVFVLSARNDISGFVSQPSLELGREHVVLCAASMRHVVAAAIAEAGGDSSDEMGTPLGIPNGWTVFRRVTPTRAVRSESDVDILNALRPLSDLRIELEGGIRVQKAEWLKHYPPEIHVHGLTQAIPEVLIDGKAASCNAQGAYSTIDSSSPGKHVVWCEGKSRSYSIVLFHASWRRWSAFSFPLGGSARSTASICGPMVHVDAEVESDVFPISVPETNPVLVGANAGDVALALRASPLRGSPCIASPSFPVVWALPRVPLRSDKKRLRVLFAGRTETLALQPVEGNLRRSRQILMKWAQLILDAGRKGLELEPQSEEIRRLWVSYTRLARSIWRSQR